MPDPSWQQHAPSRRATRAGARAPRRAGATGPLLVAGLCLLGLALTWTVASLSPAGQVKNAVALHDFNLLAQTRANTLAEAVLVLLKPPLYIIWSVGLLAVALVRERWRLAAAVAAVLLLSPLSAELLKPLLAYPHAQIGATPHVGAASWPSGHSSAAMALALCAVLVAPSRLRPLAVTLGAGFALATGCSLLIRAWHMPSDVFGGYLLAGLWSALAVAALRASDARWPTRRTERRSSGAVAAGVRPVGARVPQ
jgi:membrane-associated phospholipid phosphatase